MADPLPSILPMSAGCAVIYQSVRRDIQMSYSHKTYRGTGDSPHNIFETLAEFVATVLLVVTGVFVISISDGFDAHLMGGF